MPRTLIILLSIVITIAIQSCTGNKPVLLSENKLPSQYYTIDINRDTTLYTAKGGIITIPKGALDAHNASSVKIEIKEAYTIADIIKGGLTTKAGNGLLSSGGMIYFSAVDKNIKIIKPIAVSVPARYKQDGMQLYKGNKKSDSTIDWTDPQSLLTDTVLSAATKGKILFINNCASCHDPQKEVTGPPLAFLDKRRDPEWLRHFIHNSSTMIADGDEFARCVYEKYRKTQMTAFPQLSDEDIQNIFLYADSLAGNIDTTSIPDFKKSYDSCILYNRLAQRYEALRDSLITDNGPQVSIKAIDSISVTPENGPGYKPENMVHAAENKAVYYQFNITVTGWYNVDVLFRDLPGFENSVLTVRAKGEYREDVNIYLVIPQYKVFVPGGAATTGKDDYAFFTDDGKTPLPQNAKACIIAFGEHNGQAWFGKTDFITARQQSPEIRLSVVGKEELATIIDSMKIDGIKIAAIDSKNSNSIRKIEIKLGEFKKLKPKDCNCNCMVQQDSAEILP